MDRAQQNDQESDEIFRTWSLRLSCQQQLIRWAPLYLEVKMIKTIDKEDIKHSIITLLKKKQDQYIDSLKFIANSLNFQAKQSTFISQGKFWDCFGDTIKDLQQ